MQKLIIFLSPELIPSKRVKVKTLFYFEITV